jgi:hypothetical protein
MNIGTVLYHVKGIVLAFLTIAYVTIEDTSGSYFKCQVNVNVNLKNIRNGFINLYARAFKSNCLCLGYDILPSRPFKFLPMG